MTPVPVLKTSDDRMSVSLVTLPLIPTATASVIPQKGDIFWYAYGAVDDDLCVCDGAAWVAIVTVSGACPI